MTLGLFLCEKVLFWRTCDIRHFGPFNVQIRKGREGQTLLPGEVFRENSIGIIAATD